MIDRGDIQVEATVIAMRNMYVLPIQLNFFAPMEKADNMIDYLLSQRLPLRGAMKYGPMPVIEEPMPIAPSFDTLLEQSVTFDQRKGQKTDRFGRSIKDLEDLPKAVQPEQVRTKMLSYQLQGLGWLLRMEHPQLPATGESKQFWMRKGLNWFNSASN